MAPFYLYKLSRSDCAVDEQASAPNHLPIHTYDHDTRRCNQDAEHEEAIQEAFGGSTRQRLRM